MYTQCLYAVANKWVRQGANEGAGKGAALGTGVIYLCHRRCSGAHNGLWVSDYGYALSHCVILWSFQYDQLDLP